MDNSVWSAFRAYRRGTLGADHALIEATLPTVLFLAQSEQISDIYQTIGERAHQFKKHDVLLDWLRPIVAQTAPGGGSAVDSEPLRLALSGLESVRSQPELLSALKDFYTRLTVNGFIPTMLCSAVLLACLDRCWYSSYEPTSLNGSGWLTLLTVGAALTGYCLTGIVGHLWGVFRQEWCGWGAISLSSVYTLTSLCYFLITIEGRTNHRDSLERFLELVVCLLLSIFISALVLAPHLALVRSRPWVSGAQPWWLKMLLRLTLFSAFLLALAWTGNFVFQRSLGFELSRACRHVSPVKGGEDFFLIRARENRPTADSLNLQNPITDSQKIPIIRSAKPGSQVNWILLDHLLCSTEIEFKSGKHLDPRVRGELIATLKHRRQRRPVAHLKQRLLQEAAFVNQAPLTARVPARVRQAVEGWRFLEAHPKFESLQHFLTKEQTLQLSERFPFWSGQLAENCRYWQVEQSLLEILVADDLSYHKGETVKLLSVLKPETLEFLKQGDMVFDWSGLGPGLIEG